MRRLPPRHVVCCISGALYGVLYTWGQLLQGTSDAATPTLLLLQGVVQAMGLAMGIALMRRLVFEKLTGRPGQEALTARFYAWEPWTFSVFLIGVAFPAGLAPNAAITSAACLGVLFMQGVLYWRCIDSGARARIATSEEYIAVLFLISGFSALIYQVVWQRTLFSTFGINSESVTVIVSVFMFGLGVGALAGGYLQQRYQAHLLSLFLILEILIGVFGLLSLDLIRYVSSVSGDTSTGKLVLWVYLILAIPTLLMGATLPILVAWLQGYLKNIGQSVGLLYAFNTIGSALAAFLTVTVLFVLAGQQSAVWVAAACNFATAALIYDASRRIRRAAGAGLAEPRQAPLAAVEARTASLPYAAIFLILMAIGFISLSQEILWFRMIGFMTANRPQVFGMMLAAFLVGIAAGSLRSKSVCDSGPGMYGQLVKALFLATTVFYLALPLIAVVTAYIGKATGILLAYAAVAAVAYFTGGILPMLVHLGIAERPGDAAKSMSWLYFANIIGATLGPLATGFILLDVLSLEANIVLLSAMTLALLAAVILIVPKSAAYKARAAALMAAMAGGAWLLHAPMFSGHLEMLQFESASEPPFRHVLENRSGIITVAAGPVDTMYGNGIYDGRFNIDPLDNSNGIQRAFMLASLHRKPARVLEIGLSTGSWSKVIAEYAPLEQMKIVEINKGYPALMDKYPEIGSVLQNPKVAFFFDDGRRWLRNHPEAKFDLILMNTSFHWRSNMTNLLSADFLHIAKQRLLPGGVIYYNTTKSPDAVYTAASVFKHVTMFKQFVAASDMPFDMTEQERRANLLRFVGTDGAPLFDRNVQHRQLLDRLAREPLPELGPQYRATKGLWLITDDNMAVEYKIRSEN